MPTRGTRRGQAIWIGFLFLLILLMLVYSLYQAHIVPEQNADVEFEHSQEMSESMRQVRDRIYLTGSTGGTQSVTIDLGPDYPTRLVGLNPAPPAGRLHTVTKGNITMQAGNSPVDLSRTCEFQNTSRVQTRSLAVHIDYNALLTAPTITYSQTALYKHTDDTYVLLDDRQTLITNRTITLVPLTSSYSAAATTAVSIQMTAGEVGQTTVTTDQPLQVTLPTPLPATKWEELLADQPTVTGVTQTAETRVMVTLDPGSYSVVCYPVGIEHAPAGGVRALGAYPSGATRTPTGTPPPKATPGPTPPNATIEAVTLVRQRRGATVQHEVTVNWSATDSNGDLDTVIVRVTDLNTSTTKSETWDVMGATASGQFEAVFGRGGATPGDTYAVRLVATDDANQTDQETRTKTVAGGG